MADFRTKLAMLAGAAAMCTGMAQAQNLSCTSANAVTSGFVRAESNNDQVGDVTVTCSAGEAGSAAASVNLQVYMSPSVNITSGTIGSGDDAVSEAVAGLTASLGTVQVNGSVTGNQVTFSNIAVGALLPLANTTITITNIRIQASSIGASAGVPTAVNESIFVSGTNVNNNVVTASNVAFVTNGLGGIESSDTSSNAICNPIVGADTNFTISFAEMFATAFKTRGTVGEGGNLALNSWFNNNTETGFTATAGDNAATSGTRVSITFNNVPGNVNVYVPQTIQDTVNSEHVGTMTLVKSATDAYSAVEAASTSGSNPPPGSYGQVSISNGTGTAVYEYTGTGDRSTIEKYNVPVSLQANQSVVPAPAGAVTATVSFAPIGATSNIPNFVSGSSTKTVDGSEFIACNTTLLFPFVTNQLGFDTGLSIANTSTDLLASGGTKSAAASQSGTCTLNFFGDTAPEAVTTESVASGTTYAAAASTLAPGFQGYMIANCNFLYGHGFAYVVYNLTQNNGAAMGYLAQEISNNRKQAITGSAISSTNPER